jgi:plastocyanin
VELQIVEPSTDYRTWGYEPSETRVPVGTTVNWTNTGGAAHTVTSDDAKSFDSGSISPGQRFSLVMRTVGPFPYHCTLHPWMKAVITVTA